MIPKGSHGARGDGASTCFEFALRFDAWVRSLRGPLTPERIADYWNVSRATSYRYLRAYEAARGRFARERPAMLEDVA